MSGELGTGSSGVDVRELTVGDRRSIAASLAVLVGSIVAAVVLAVGVDAVRAALRASLALLPVAGALLLVTAAASREPSMRVLAWVLAGVGGVVGLWMLAVR